ncbi:MAG TPA: hypothetical protein VE685_01800 [Thermoanaerobaculia bacterium]|nr:hypothetical protein [Thermoanaerobaculia bacterium]
MSTRNLAIPALFLSLALAAPVTMLEAADGRAGIHDDQSKKDRNRNRDRNQNRDRDRDRNEDRNDDRRCRESERLPMRFRGLDRNCDGMISRSEWRGNDVSFRQHDRNGDGMLSGSELLGNGHGDDDRDDDRNRSRFDRLDRNDDGRISLDEWPGRRSAFERLDRNDDGFLSRDEFDDE